MVPSPNSMFLKPHFREEWQLHVATWFNQLAQKSRRHGVWQTQARLTAKWTHQAHCEGPHSEGSHRSMWQGLELVRVTGGWHSQDGGTGHGDLGGYKKVEQVHRVPASQHAMPTVLLQARPLPREALSPQEERQLC